MYVCCNCTFSPNAKTWFETLSIYTKLYIESHRFTIYKIEHIEDTKLHFHSTQRCIPFGDQTITNNVGLCLLCCDYIHILSSISFFPPHMLRISFSPGRDRAGRHCWIYFFWIPWENGYDSLNVHPLDHI